MSSDYWNLNAEALCPECGSRRMRELRTHWLGEVGSCLNTYTLGQPVLELESIAAALIDGLGDRHFVDSCVDCRAFLHFGGRVENEAVVEVWPVKPRILSQERSQLIASRIFGDD